jgi:VIT1/CCC1 family predicted Fe2+/Mn2+ transporter
VEYNESEARETLALTYQIRGLPEEDANRFVQHLVKNKDLLVQVLARERLNKTEEGSWVSAVSGALSTGIGAFILIIPFFFMAGIPAIIGVVIISLIPNFVGGASKSLITICTWSDSGFEISCRESLS